MIFKKKGQGEGKWNVPGGKTHEGEHPKEAAIRECIEETGISPISLIKKGEIEFLFPNGGSWSNHSTIFLATKFEGQIVKETEECTASWISLDKIPYEQMWEGDKLWIPDLLLGKEVFKRYTFRADNTLQSVDDL